MFHISVSFQGTKAFAGVVDDTQLRVPKMQYSVPHQIDLRK